LQDQLDGRGGGFVTFAHVIAERFNCSRRASLLQAILNQQDWEPAHCAAFFIFLLTRGWVFACKTSEPRATVYLAFPWILTFRSKGAGQDYFGLAHDVAS
jgi:hypothetical protein